MNFYLGTHHPNWLSELGVPLFVARQRMAGRKTLPKARAPWALDSGGFSEIATNGRWTVSEDQYVDEVQRFSSEIGLLDWVAPQDWMCEPVMLARTGLSIAEHQRRTTESYLSLLKRGIPVIPVLQGWEVGDYLDHAHQYEAVGIELARCPTVGVGTVCRRQAMYEAEEIMRSLAALGLKLHGFGFKKAGLKRCADVMYSADSMAWSYSARRDDLLDGCVGHINCANCRRYAMLWRDELLAGLRGNS